MKTRLGTIAIALGVWFGSAMGQARAAEPAPPPNDSADPSFREQSIYIPYEKLWKTFEKKQRGVFMPYEEFIELWKAVRRETVPETTAEPPAAAIVSDFSANAVVAGDVMRVDASLHIEVLKKGWSEVPLRLSDVAMTAASIGGKPARLTHDAERGVILLLEHDSNDPVMVTLDLQFAKALSKTPGRNSVSVQCPQAPVSRWDIRIPEPGVKVDIRPILAATEVPPAASADETRILAFVGSAPSVTIEWTPKAEGAKGLEALASVDAEHEIRIEKGVVQTLTRLTYEISRAEVTELSAEVPAGHKVVNVFDPNVREWSVKATGDVQVITAQLFEPTQGTQPLAIELEQFGAAETVAVPLVRALNVGRQRGAVVAAIGDGLRAEPAAREGLLQVDAEDLSPGLRRRKWDYAFRYAALPFRLELAVEDVRPRIVADCLTEVHLAPRELTVDYVAVFDVQRAGVFQLDVVVPRGYEVRQVTGSTVGGAVPVEVDSHHLADAGTNGTRVAVNLSRRAAGRVGLAIQLHRPLREASLLTPTGETIELSVPIPRPESADMIRETGRLVVYGPESLRINPVTALGMRAVSHARAVSRMQTTQQRREERPALSYAFSDAAAGLTIDVERRAPHVTVRQLLVMRIESGVVKFEATFFYDTRYSGVKELRVDVPAEQAGAIRVTTPGVRHRVLADADRPADLPDGYVTWLLTGETEFLGSSRFQLQWEQPIEKLEVGGSVIVPVPRLVPRGTDRAWGQVVVAKAESIDVAPASPVLGVDSIDPSRELMPGASVKGAAQAFEYHDAWQLAVRATRYEPKEIKGTSIERGLVRAVLTRGDATSVQALYRTRSTRQRLSLILPDEVEFDTQPVRINGRPVSLEQGEGGGYFVPLTAQDARQAFLLEVRYLVRGRGLAIETPSFPDEPAVQHVYLSVFMPKRLTYLGSAGPWNDELVWVVKGFSAWPRGRRSSDWLMNWVTEGLSVDDGSIRNFATDGRHVLFSALRPEQGPAGALRLRAAGGTLFRSVMLVLVVGVGLALVPARGAVRLLAVSAAFIALVVIAVFMPSLARAVASNATAAGVVVVLVVWGLWQILVVRPRRPRPPAPDAPPPLPPPGAELGSPDEPAPTNAGGQDDA